MRKWLGGSDIFSRSRELRCRLFFRKSAGLCLTGKVLSIKNFKLVQLFFKAGMPG
jgi:hypothetical protein